MALRSGQSSYNQYDLPSDDEECLMQKNEAETTPGQSHHTACLLTTARRYFHPLPESPQNWGQSNQDLHDYHSDPVEIRSA